MVIWCNGKPVGVCTHADHEGYRVIWKHLDSFLTRVRTLDWGATRARYLGAYALAALIEAKVVALYCHEREIRGLLNESGPSGGLEGAVPGCCAKYRLADFESAIEALAQIRL